MAISVTGEVSPICWGDLRLILMFTASFVYVHCKDRLHPQDMVHKLNHKNSFIMITSHIQIL